jgi:hypothetical protein
MALRRVVKRPAAYSGGEKLHPPDAGYLHDIMRVRLIPFVVLATLLFAACGESASEPAPTPTSGISGIVLIGPTCPVERPESPCPDRPYEATILALDADGREVARARSAADGRFRLALAPGAYVLHPESSMTPPTAADQTVDVFADEYTNVSINFDSGIR